MKKLSVIFCVLLFFTNNAGAEEMKNIAVIEITTGSEKA